MRSEKPLTRLLSALECIEYEHSGVFVIKEQMFHVVSHIIQQSGQQGYTQLAPSHSAVLLALRVVIALKTWLYSHTCLQFLGTCFYYLSLGK